MEGDEVGWWWGIVEVLIASQVVIPRKANVYGRRKVFHAPSVSASAMLVFRHMLCKITMVLR